MHSDDVEGDGEKEGAETAQDRDIKESGVVRVYQLGLKSQRSFGRVCGPRLRSFEGNN